MFTGKGAKSISEKQTDSLRSAAAFDQGEWSVIIKRRRDAEGAYPLAEKAFTPIAFSVWDGFSEERGNKRGVTAWFSLYLEPAAKESALKPMLLYGGGLLLLEILIVWYVRRRAEPEPEV